MTKCRHGLLEACGECLTDSLARDRAMRTLTQAVGEESVRRANDEKHEPVDTCTSATEAISALKKVAKYLAGE